jgi:hypothetical protein
MKDLEKILGGKPEIKRQSDAWKERTKNAPPLDPETQPNLYRIDHLIKQIEFKINEQKT